MTDAPNKTPALHVRDLRKRYDAGPASVEVLKGVDLDLQPGAFEAVMGPSGSGKSTLLHLLAGLLAADAGEIIIGGERLTGMDDTTAVLDEAGNCSGDREFAVIGMGDDYECCPRFFELGLYCSCDC